MADMVKSFRELTPELQATAGGKGGTLARLFQAGYPVPVGFVVLPTAFRDEKLTDEAWDEVRVHLHAIRKDNARAQFAVRSSALSEDSARTSFAGEFETVLNVETDKEIQDAICTVFRSREAERVKAYSAIQGMDQLHQIAIVVQLMVPSEISGVLFTADPVTGSFASMIGNYVHGLGERLVSGEADAHSFKLMRPKGKYDGPEEFKKYSSMLYQYATRLERELGAPQDIEWAVAKGKLYLLQARPITTLTGGNLDTYEINESLASDALWVNTNVGEAIPDVITPFTWSLVRGLDNESGFIPGYYLWSGNICGRIYSNISQRLSAITALYGWDAKRAMALIGEIFGHIPEDLSIPVYPFSRLHLIKEMLPGIKRLIWNTLKASKNMPSFLKDTPVWCGKMTERIGKIKTEAELLSL